MLLKNPAAMHQIKIKNYSKKIIIYFSFAFYAGSVTAQNLILNGGFETATVGIPTGTPLTPYPTLLDNWSAVNVDGEFMYDLSYAHTGTGFLSVLNNPAGNPVTAWLGAPWAISFGYDRAIQVVPVSQSTLYELQFWLRSGAGIRYSGYDEGTALVQVEQLTPAPDTIVSFSVYTPLAWQQFGFTFITGSTCTSVAILFSIYDTDASDAWFDDVDLHLAKMTTTNPLPRSGAASVYPTFFSAELKINSETGDESTLVIYDSHAQKVFQKLFTGETTLNTETFSKGIYFYSLSSKSGVIKNGKLIRK
jgi:hypothetical protein